MTKAVLEAENEGSAKRVAAVVPSPALAVPASLHASLMARLDRLGHAKQIAQIGAAIGRAVVIYNHLARAISGYRSLLGDASAQLLLMVSRGYRDRVAPLPRAAE